MSLCFLLLFFFFFKQKTAYEMRISDWSSDVCSSDLLNVGHRHPRVIAAVRDQLDRYTHTAFQVVAYEPYVELCERLNALAPISGPEIGRASCRERVCKYV